jgi:hypothetical protein
MAGSGRSQGPVQVTTPLIAVPAGSAFGLPGGQLVHRPRLERIVAYRARVRVRRQLGTFRNGRWAGYRLTTEDVYLILPHQLDLRLSCASKPVY